MRVLKEVCEQLSGGNEPVFGAVFVVWARQGGYFQNVKSLGAFSSRRVELELLGGGRLYVWGEGLCVKKYCENDVLLSGNIHSVSDGETEGGRGEK